MIDTKYTHGTSISWWSDMDVDVDVYVHTKANAHGKANEFIWKQQTSYRIGVLKIDLVWFDLIYLGKKSKRANEPTCLRFGLYRLYSTRSQDFDLCSRSLYSFCVFCLVFSTGLSGLCGLSGTCVSVCSRLMKGIWRPVFGDVSNKSLSQCQSLQSNPEQMTANPVQLLKIDFGLDTE